MKRALPLLLALTLATPALAGTFTNEVLVLNATSTLMTTTLLSRRAIEIQNIGPNAIYCAVVAAAASSAEAVLTKSRRISAGDSWPLDLLPGRFIYCRAATADQVTGAATIVTELD